LPTAVARAINHPKNIATQAHFPYLSTPCSGKINGLQGSDLFGCAVSSVVEHYLDTVGVGGSKPPPRTILCFNFLH
jgi:hypothetical protein